MRIKILFNFFLTQRSKTAVPDTNSENGAYE